MTSVMARSWAKTLVERIGNTFDNEVELSGDEAREIANLLHRHEKIERAARHLVDRYGDAKWLADLCAALNEGRP